MMDDEEETETNTGEEDEEMKEVDDMIVRASRELEKVAEENQQLLEILDKPGCLLKESRNDAQIANEGGEDFVDNNVIKQLEEAERQAKDTANVIYELKTRVGELLKKEELTEEETKELGYKNKKLKEQMILFEGRTKKIQYLIEKTNILNTKPTKNSNDISQKVLLDKKGDDSVKSGVCSCCGENIRSSLTNIPSFAKKLSESYTMQEKLASENADLESVRFKLQEELLNKDRTLECLQRELGNLQNEMRLVSRENNVLNDKLKKLQRKEIGQNVKQQKSLDTAVVSTKLQEYSDNTYQLEKQLTDMENDVKCLHEEICAVQQEREHLEQHRKMMCMSRPCITPYLMSPLNTSRHMCVAPFSTSTTLSKGLSGQVLKELSEQYDKLESDLTSKLNETITLKTDYEKLKNLTKEAEQFKRITEDKIKECEKTMNGLKCQNKVPVEQEAQLDSAKKRFGKAQDALREQQLMIKYQKKHLEDVKNKYMEAQHQLEEQKRKINSKIDSIGGGALSLGAQIVTSLQDKLDEVKI
ncbi:hypothetical protein HHI36_006566 [Cryptolaemus montrouzieri]|uniref:Uncharacterized protein n=1 Tax=Cryptolaemus montrouzieri TaxID=559131 RepID=A0ABD2NYH8_9CUCU